MPMNVSFSALPLWWVPAALVLLGVSACSPTFNWRDVRAEGGTQSLNLLLPCKPDRVEKVVPLGGQPTPMSMIGCDAGGATFAVAVADLGEASPVAAVLTQWQALTLGNMKAAAASVSSRPLKVAGASGEPAPVLVLAQGQRADGSVVQGQAAYFYKGRQVVQAVMYAPKIAPDAAETFFGSFKFD